MNVRTLHSPQVEVRPLRSGAACRVAIGKARIMLLLGVLVALTTASSCTSPTLFQSNFDATAVDQPPSPTQAVGTASVDGPPGSVLVVAAPPNAQPSGKWLQITVANQSGQVAAFQGKLKQQPGNGTYVFSTALFIPPTGPQGEDNVATISFEALAHCSKDHFRERFTFCL